MIANPVRVVVRLHPSDGAVALNPYAVGRLRTEVAAALVRHQSPTPPASVHVPFLFKDIPILIDAPPDDWAAAEYTIDVEVPPVPGTAAPTAPQPPSDALTRVVDLPHPAWRPLWQRIYLDDAVKSRALYFVLAVRRLGTLGLSDIALAQHRTMLFIGPPGTGKTTLCRGLANEAVLRLADDGVSRGVCVEINAHRLSSELLGKGPRLIEAAFTQIRQQYAEPGRRQNIPVFVLADEVESLVSNRAAALNDANPVDVYRSVNAVITQLDLLAESCRNVFVLATSNLGRAIDPAFRDRIDLEITIGLPDRTQRARILRDVAEELAAVTKCSLPVPADHASISVWEQLLDLTEGLSGRRLRKLFLESLIGDAALVADPARLTWTHILASLKTHQSAQAR